MYNSSLKQPIIFTLQGFLLPKEVTYPLFVLTLLIYTTLVAGNGIVFVVILIEKKLHEPMYIMVCNLVVCDFIGGTAVMIRFMSDFLSEDRTIHYAAAIVQAFCVHTYGAAAQTILSIMAYDRYVAICEPLRYHTIMSTGKLIALCSIAWGIAVILILILFIMNVTVPLCGTLILHVYCSNASILRLACVDITVNNIYGLCITWILSTGSFLVIAFCYVKILIACLVKRDNNSKSKAIQTCSSHLLMYVIFEIASLILIISQRFEKVSLNLKMFCSILSMVVPPFFNPIIYGINTKEIRKHIVKQFKKKVLPMV
ncbi:olfactory receptor 52B2-like [Lepisosteus oculatus]|uniref:olfactory receptor 52B2-like n=1 Tax=Lepisosteus oculatus TaxID=7918 RepID=UPI00371BD7BA